MEKRAFVIMGQRYEKNPVFQSLSGGAIFPVRCLESGRKSGELSEFGKKLYIWCPKMRK